MKGSIFVFKRAFEQHIRKITVETLGPINAAKLTEIDFIKLLATPSCPARKEWQKRVQALKWGLRLTPFERRQALAYWNAAGELVPQELRFPSDNPNRKGRQHEATA